MELLRIIFHAFFILLLVLTRLNELYSINKIFINNAPFSNPYIFKLMKLDTNRLINPYSYNLIFVFMA
ncbi:hypothetical protein ECC15_00450 [Helicobacter pylori]|nr:hypothetical protein ECB96_01140 [Helicobacter pylori]RVY36594.1 hypothetical protein ECC15_00450 [Helicobacter pylori]